MLHQQIFTKQFISALQLVNSIMEALSILPAGKAILLFYQLLYLSEKILSSFCLLICSSRSRVSVWGMMKVAEQADLLGKEENLSRDQSLSPGTG